MYKKDESSCLHVRDGFLIHIRVRIVMNQSKMDLSSFPSAMVFSNQSCNALTE